MSTPTFGLPFPVLGDVPNVPSDVQGLAEATDTALTGVQALVAGKRVFAGTFVGTASGTGQISVSWSGFASTPTLLVGLGDSAAVGKTVVPLHSTLSTSGGTVLVENAAGDPVNGGGYRINFIAVGDPA